MAYIPAEEIKYPRRVEYRGKNAGHVAVGLNVGTGFGMNVSRLTPSHSRDGLGDCYIEIPNECIPDLIKELQKKLI